VRDRGLAIRLTTNGVAVRIGWDDTLATVMLRCRAGVRVDFVT
jgi:hypothetical protein